MLESTMPGFLKTDVYRYAKSNNMPVGPLKSFTYVGLLRIDMARLFVLPKSRKRILEQKKGSPEITKRRTVGLEFLALRNRK